ncbi:recombinase family protein [Brevundimonas sp. EAKA]|uniref:recombinase family protein n=1 Tax=Brevundimonas sp. EAKA TaxID=1495854 RepID=UPI0009DCFDD8|nr:recombinase family protein [Brevundimonas sp. EAKA]
MTKPAAQYLRMSTDHQRYSLVNQAATIAVWAGSRDFHIVRTYEDAGKSGLSIRGRDGLKQLLADVLTGPTDYKDILVRDVSRWGRFQDPDQAAHYEFVCREAGVRIHYCAEPFENDGSVTSTIVKHLKRVMAGEYSRELSGRVKTAQRRAFLAGNVRGGVPAYGTRRQAFSVSGEPGAVLAPGERKSSILDTVRLVRGPSDEVAVVRSIFRDFTKGNLSAASIATSLNGRGVSGPRGLPWSGTRVSSILKDETFTGFVVYDKSVAVALGERLPAPRSDWKRLRVMPSLVAPALFAAAQARFERFGQRHRSDDQLLQDLRLLWKSEGFLSAQTIIRSPLTQSIQSYVRRFGSLSAVYARVGWTACRRPEGPRRLARMSDDDLIDLLRNALQPEDRLTAKLIDKLPGVPSSAYYKRRLGSLSATYARLGWKGYLRRSYDVVPWRSTSDDGLIAILRKIHAEAGYLSTPVIDAHPAAPHSSYFKKRFGSLAAAYALAGHAATRSEMSTAMWKRRERRQSL